MGDDFDALRPSLDDWDGLLSDEEVKALNEEDQLQYMEAWFRYYFEDPAHETPYESAEGGYQYIWGGPYEARDELHDQFGGLVSDVLIDRLVEELNGDGYEWAPTSNHPSRSNDRPDDEPEGEWDPDLDELVRELEQGTEPHFDEVASRHRRTVTERLDALEQVIAGLRHGGMGHNHPPEAIEDVEELKTADVDEIMAIAAEVKTQIAEDQPDAIKVAKAGVQLRDVGKWLAAKLDKFADEGFKAAGKTIGTVAPPAVTVAALGGWHQLVQCLADAAHAIAVWIATITLPF